MNKDLIIGILVSLGLHAGGLLLFNGKATVVEHHVEEAQALEVIEIPTIPPDEPEATPTPAEQQATYTPMLADVPSAISMDTPFINQMQPPPPPNQDMSKGVITIPEARTNVASSLTGQVFNLSDLDQNPQPTYQQAPQYPYEMKRAGINGTATVGFIVDNTGAVRDAYIVSSSHSEFEAPALQAIQKWRFRPGRRKGQAVNVRMQQPLTFKLTDSR